MRKIDTKARRVFLAFIIIVLAVTMLAALSACNKEGGSNVVNIIVYGGHITGTDSHTGSFERDTQISVTANEPEGKLFECWKKGESIVSTDNPYSFTITADTTLTAVFKEANPTPVYTVTLNNGYFKDTDKTTDSFKKGTKVWIKATVPAGKNFASWNNGAQILSVVDPYELTVESDMNLTAVFKDAPKYNLNIIGGTYNGVTSAVITEGGEVSIIPDEREGFVFSGWYVNGVSKGNENPLKIKVTADTSVQAEFKEIYSLKVNKPNDIVETSERVDGERVTITAETNVAGYEFLRWVSKDNALLSKNASYTFEVAHDTEITALYRKLSSANGKTITAAGCTIYSDSACTQKVGDGHNITDYAAGTYYIKADYADTLTLEKISYFKPGAVSDDIVLGTAATHEKALNPESDGDVAYYALYSRDYTVTVTGGGALSGGGTEKTVKEYESVTVTAPTLANKKFQYWKLNGEVVTHSTATQTFVIKTNTTLEAVYVERYTVTITNNMNDPTLNVTAYDKGTYIEISIDSIPHENLVFYRWTDGDGNHYTSEKMVIQAIDKNWTLTAEFKRLYTVTIQNLDGSGTYSDTKQYVEDEQVTVTFVRAEFVPAALEFMGWSFDGGNTIFSSSETAEFTADGNVTVEAVMRNIYTQEAVSDYSAYDATMLKYPNLASSSEKNFETSFILPGIKAGQNFVPQGIAYLKNYKLQGESKGRDYAFVSGYISSQNTAGISNSMLYVLDMSGKAADSSAAYRNGKLLREIFLLNEDGTPYIGRAQGIAVTEKNVYVSDSAQVFGISLDTVMNAKSSAFIKFGETIGVPVAASYLSYADGVLWAGETVGENYAGDPSHLADGFTAWTVGYKINVNGKSVPAFQNEEVDGVRIPDYVLRHGGNVSGMAVAGNKIVLSTSTGRTNKSKIYVYNNQVYNPTNGLGNPMEGNMADSPGNVSIKGRAVPYWDLSSHVSMKEVPPMVSGIAVYKDTINTSAPAYKLYVVNSSAADVYLNGTDNNGKALDPIGCAWIIKIDQESKK